MKLFISVVSHKHQALITELGTLERLAQFSQVKVILRDNVEEKQARRYCQDRGIYYVLNASENGFSRNNNLNFLHAISLGMKDRDYFVLLNPDVDMSAEMVQRLIEQLSSELPPLAAPNLYLNHQKTVFDDNLRCFPSFKSFVKNYLFNDRATVVDKSHPEKVPENYWASGAFLAVRASLYRELEGFDESYFMYCEDVDFCLRANRYGERITFLSEVNAVHYRRRSSQQFLSIAFFQHVKSVFFYHFASRQWRKNKSCLQPNHKQMSKVL
ncbi:glycosyltransferase family 2 protein [Vibrio sp. FNV 38]|nr:glycosyltransferase family 2 protein [Vibrio sp. FNV 38]